MEFRIHDIIRIAKNNTECDDFFVDIRDNKKEGIVIGLSGIQVEWILLEEWNEMDDEFSLDETYWGESSEFRLVKRG